MKNSMPRPKTLSEMKGSIFSSRCRTALVAGFLAAILTACSTPSVRDPSGAAGKEKISMPATSNVLVMAHRGFRGIAPENTVLAAQKGYDSGADYWETDVAASSDGELIIMHDDNLARTTNVKTLFPKRGPWTVYDFTFAELRSLDSGSWYSKADPFNQIAFGHVTREDQESFVGLKVPTLAEALDLTQKNGWKINIEIKDATGRACDLWLVEKVAELVVSMKMTESVVISSFNHEYLVRVKKAAPGIQVAALIDKPIDDPVATLKHIGAIALNPNFKYLDEETVKKVRQAGFNVYVWTPNEKADMERLVKWGVTALITDFPDRALDVLGRSESH
ncbi:MAG TPA: glycerophosphodiester phosphodiesterase family protein [Rectinemataceae bacterium]|nr:glycerophosphodiester phosphodiesterase family protein [Rectinemataceae bacterium]